MLIFVAVKWRILAILSPIMFYKYCQCSFWLPRFEMYGWRRDKRTKLKRIILLDQYRSKQQRGKNRSRESKQVQPVLWKSPAGKNSNANNCNYWQCQEVILKERTTVVWSRKSWVWISRSGVDWATKGLFCQWRVVGVRHQLMKSPDNLPISSSGGIWAWRRAPANANKEKNWQRPLLKRGRNRVRHGL